METWEKEVAHLRAAKKELEQLNDLVLARREKLEELSPKEALTLGSVGASNALLLESLDTILEALT